MSSEQNPKWDPFILWLATPSLERGAVQTEEQWAEANGLSEARIMRRWKTNPKFQARQAYLTPDKAPTVDKSINVNQEAVTTGIKDVEATVIREKITAAARGGDLKAAEAYFKLFGKTYLEEQAATRASDLSVMELEDLVLKSVEVLGTDLVISHLESLGYRVISPVMTGVKE